ATLSMSRSSVESAVRQSSSASYRRPTGRSLIGPRGLSRSLADLRLCLGGASGPKLRFRAGAPAPAPPSAGRGPAKPPGLGPVNPPPPPPVGRRPPDPPPGRG